MKKVLFISLLFFALPVLKSQAQAQLTVDNHSNRTLQIKVMRQGGGYHSSISVRPYAAASTTFSETGSYYLKTKAVAQYKDPIYKKGKAFRVYNGTDGYSVLTLTIQIEESTSFNPTEGASISKSEFDRNDQ
jgi:hypothetical protein